MKLTIKTENGQKVVDLKNDLQFNTLEGEQYVFSSGFSNYVLSFKDDQASVVLTFNVDGKSIKVELNGIVPHLQANTQDTANPTAIIINKGINNKDVDNLLTNADFNGGEIIDRLEAIISKPVELGDAKSSNVTLITDYQTLLESLGAAAAGGEAAAGNANGNGSTFNSIFSLTDGGLNDIAATDRWVNLSESISTIPVDSADTIAPQTIVDPINVNVNLIAINTNVTEGENASYKVTLTDDAGNPILAVVDMTVTFKYTYITANGEDITETISVVIPAGSSEVPVLVKTIDDNLSERKETFTIEIDTVSNQEQFDSVTVNKVPVLTDILDSDKPTVSISVNPAQVAEGDVAGQEATMTYTVALTNPSSTPSKVYVELSGQANNADYTTSGLLSDANGSYVIIPANSTSVDFTVTTVVDNIYEGSETVVATISNATTTTTAGIESLTITTPSAIGTIVDDNGTLDSDKPTVSISVNPAQVAEGDVAGQEATMTYTVALTNPSSTPSKVYVELSGQANNADYTTSGLLSDANGSYVIIPANSTSVDFTVTTVVDNIYEGSETVVATISNATTTTTAGIESLTITTPSAIGTIVDDNGTLDSDKPTVSISVNPAQVAEGDVAGQEATMTYTVALTNPSSTPSKVYVELSGQANNADYTTSGLLSDANGSYVIIPANSTSVDFTVTTVVDNIYEGSETVVATISNATTTTTAGIESLTITTPSAIGTIVDDNGTLDSDKPTVSISVNPAQVAEGDVAGQEATMTYTVALTNPSSTPSKVYVELSGQANNADYTTSGLLSDANGSYVIIPANSTSVDFTVTTVVDNIYEGSETVVATISNATTTTTAGIESLTITTPSAIGTIVDDNGTLDSDKPTVSISVNPAQVAEGDVAGQEATMTYTVALTNPSSTPSKVYVELSGQANNADYTTSGLLSDANGSYVIIPANSTSVDFTVTTVVDNIYEGSETVVATISNATTTTTAGIESLTITTPSAIGTIVDDNGTLDSDKPTVSISVNPAQVAEGDVAGQEATMTYTVALTNPSSTPSKVYVELSGQANNADYTTSGLLSDANGSYVIIPANSTSVDFTVTTVVDNIYEGSETVVATISNATTTTTAGIESLTITTPSAIGTIVDDNGTLDSDKPTVSISVNPAQVAEGDVAGQEATMTYTVALTNPSSTPSKVYVELSGQANNADYTTSGLLSDANGSYVIIPANSTSVDFTVTTVVDNIYEGSETVVATISNATTTTTAGIESLTITTPSAIGTIVDDNGTLDSDKPTVSISVNPAQVAEGDVAGQEATMTYTVALTNPSSTPSKVYVELSGQANNADYTTSGLLSDANGSYVIIPANSTSVDFTVTTVVDNIYEGSETVVATISNATTTTTAGIESLTITTPSAIGTIVDDNGTLDSDKPTVSISVNPAQVAEGDVAGQEATMTYTVALTNPSSTPSKVYVELSGQANNADYTTSGLLSDANGSYVIIPANSTSVDFTVTTVVDNIYEGSETVVATISNATTNGTESLVITTPSATGTIVDKPEADPIKTTSNLVTDVIPSTYPINKVNIAFFKKLDIGGGLDGDLSVSENDSLDPADLGGTETIESNLKFDITSLPSYGDVYIEKMGVFTKLDSSNISDASTLLSTADNVYWSSTHEQVIGGTEKSIGGVYNTGIETSWQSNDVTVITRDKNNVDTTFEYSIGDGIGVKGSTGGSSNQLGYDASIDKSESIIFDFSNAVTDATVSITHLISHS